MPAAIFRATSVRSAIRLGLLAAALVAGCAPEPHFPKPLQVCLAEQENVLAFDMDGNGRPDFWEYQRPDDRKHAIAYARPGTDGPAPRIELDALPPADCPHLVLVLDGVPFEIVDELWQQGRFRFFYPPARVVCCYPSMTDLALAEMFHASPCLGYQALYFDRRANRLSDANAVYLSGRNSPWLAHMNYRCSLRWDALVYLDPQAVFRHELGGIQRTFRAVSNGEAYAYSVGTAGLATRGGRAAIVRYLTQLDQLCERIVYERRGRVKITLTADHGHNLVANRLVSFDKLLKAGGYHPAQSLRGPRDVVPISYGLVTYADFYTRDPAGVAACLLQHDAVEFACYPAGTEIVVCDRDGQARIARGAAGFTYDASQGDPLGLADVVDTLRRDGKVSATGEIDEEALFRATVDQRYPDPLARIWGAFHEVAQNPPDVIVNLRDGTCHGSPFFNAMVGEVASTHGALNALNSTTFVLTMLGDPPPTLRSREVLPALEALRQEK
jgi:hypothetical protein